MTQFRRTFALEDIQIRSGGDGRTVEAYAAVFDTPVEIRDWDGEYLETIDRAAFDRTIAHKGTKFGVFYNHAMTMHGTPSERGSMPIGTPLEVKADERGLYTLTRYNETPLAEEALEAIRTGAITGQSFGGRIIASTPDVPKRGYQRGKDGNLIEVRRTEIALVEYGPTPMPAYEDAVILGVRNAGCTCQQTTDTTACGHPDRTAPPGTDPLDEHSARLSITHNLIRMKMRERGLR